jgi:hypothetical protein
MAVIDNPFNFSMLSICNMISLPKLAAELWEGD